MLGEKKEKESEEKKFDTRTHIRDAKSGRVVALNPYRLIVSNVDGKGSVWLYERPVGSGLFYYSNNELAVEESKAGVEKRKKALEEASRTELEKAQADYEAAGARVKEAAAKHDAEEAKKAKLAKGSK